MKNTKYITGVAVAIALTSCDLVNLDREFPTTLSQDQIFASFNYNSERVNNIYSYLPSGFLAIDGAMLASASDEAEHTGETSGIHKFNTGSWSPLDNPDNAWSYNYAGIRAANVFLSTTNDINLDQYRLDPEQQTLYESQLAEINRWKFEVRFLRAFFYFELFKRYGGVPIITDVLAVDDDLQNVPRNTMQEVVQFISDECDVAAAELPETYPGASLGRVTKGAALALKSRLLLYAASDLFNTPGWAGGYSTPELISVSGDRQARWKAAADAAKAVIDLTGAGYSLASDYRNLFRSFNNGEIILVRRNGPTNTFEMASYPVGYDLGNSGTTPSQNLVDAYEMADGSAFDWSNPTHAAAPYDNRDPRLQYTVLTNNTVFKSRPVEAWTGGRDGKGSPLATKTGYYLKKYVDEGLNLLQGNTSVHSWIHFRLAEMYLNYAEALNEYNPGDPDIKTYVDLVRARPGVNMPALAGGLSQSEMRAKIRNERRIELAFEGHRFWDVRRWMEAPTALGAPLRGVEITKTGESSFTYTPIAVENREFDPKMYLYPIPQSELFLTKGWPQNPLW
jgi:hypothetical protein